MSRTIKFPDSNMNADTSFCGYGIKGMYNHKDHESERKWRTILNRKERHRENQILRIKKENYSGPKWQATSRRQDNYTWEIY